MQELVAELARPVALSDHAVRGLARPGRLAATTWRPDDRGGPTGPAAAPASLELKDGTRVLIRPITNDDRATLIRIFERLSARSRYLRFLGPKSRLTERELDYLTQVDHADHEALLATDMADGQPLGVCRYVRTPSDGAAAEVAIAVVDAWQARGLGTALLRLLAEHALAEGIRRFTAVVLGKTVGSSR